MHGGMKHISEHQYGYLFVVLLVSLVLLQVNKIMKHLITIINLFLTQFPNQDEKIVLKVGIVDEEFRGFRVAHFWVTCFLIDASAITTETNSEIEFLGYIPNVFFFSLWEMTTKFFTRQVAAKEDYLRDVQ